MPNSTNSIRIGKRVYVRAVPTSRPSRKNDGNGPTTTCGGESVNYRRSTGVRDERSSNLGRDHRHHRDVVRQAQSAGGREQHSVPTDPHVWRCARDRGSAAHDGGDAGNFRGNDEGMTWMDRPGGTGAGREGPGGTGAARQGEAGRGLARRETFLQSIEVRNG